MSHNHAKDTDTKKKHKERKKEKKRELYIDSIPILFILLTSNSLCNKA
jgi:hypothetical protein